MNAWLLASLLTAAAAVLGTVPSAERRLAALALPGRSPGRSPARGGPFSVSVRRHTAGQPAAARPWVSWVLDLSVLTLVVSVLPGVLGVVLAVPLTVACHRWFVRLPSRDRRARAAAARRQLPLVLELVAAALYAGATPATAVALAADASGQAVTSVLREVAAGLRLGAPAAEAWRPAMAVDGFDALARIAVRSEASGAALAGACAELARRERSRRHLEAQAAVKRSGVWAVLPLALCFLPAFVLLGVVPVVVGLLQSVVV
jgi:Flp pilus assembly protein TadB